MERNHRLYWVDNLRFFAMLCVLIGHSCHPFPNSPIMPSIDFCIVTFNMYLFFYLSGYVSYKRYETIDNIGKVVRQVWNNVNRILLPAYAAALVVPAAYMLCKGSWIGLTMPYWFLLSIFCLISVFAICRWLSLVSRCEWLGNIIFVTVILLLSFYKTNGLNWTSEFPLVFLFGYYDRKHDILKKVYSRVNDGMIWVVLAIYFLSLCLYRGHNFYLMTIFDSLPNTVVWFCYRQVVAVIALFLLVRACRKFYDHSIRFITYFGTKTIAIYTVSVAIQETLQPFILTTENGIDVLWKCLSFFVSYSAITFVIVRSLDTNRITRRLFLGE